MDFKDFIAGVDDNQRRLDKVIRKFLDSSRLSEIYKLIRKGLIKVNKKKSSPEYRINTGDTISIASFLLDSEKENIEISTPNLDISKYIIFENQHILILNKPYDVNIHGSDDSLEKIVTTYYKSKYDNNSLSFTPGPLHRLDRKTTGLVAFSFSLEGAHWFTENIKNHKIKKIYAGIIQGDLVNQEEWKDYITKNDDENYFATVTASSESDLNSTEEKVAETLVTPILRGTYKNTKVTLAKFNIKTGRKHQIRSQSSLHKHPLLGDVAYNGIKINEEQDFYLQAYELNIPENNLGLPEKIKIDLNDNFVTILNYCGIRNIEL